jgi:shikimate kinase
VLVIADTDVLDTLPPREFRSLEARVISRLLDQGQTVVATGGGAFMNADTRERVRESGISVWLKAELDVLLRRVKRKNDRPLLRGDNPELVLKRLLAEREPTYAKANITVISRDVPHDEVVDTIIEALNEYLEPETGEPQS